MLSADAATLADIQAALEASITGTFLQSVDRGEQYFDCCRNSVVLGIVTGLINKSCLRFTEHKKLLYSKDPMSLKRVQVIQVFLGIQIELTD